MKNANTIKNVKKNVVDQDASIFQLFDEGISNEEIAGRYGLKVSYVERGMRTKWRKYKGIARTRKANGTSVLKTVKTYAFNLLKADNMNYINIDKAKFPILGVSENEIQYAGIDFGQVVVKTINAHDFKANGYSLSK